MTVLGVFCIGTMTVCMALIIQHIRGKRELRRMAQFLRERDTYDNARLTVEVRTRDFLILAHSINRELDTIRAERNTLEAQEREFKAGLTELSHDIRTPLAGAQGYLQLMREEDDEKRRDAYLVATARRLEDLRELLDQLFFYTQISETDYSPTFEHVNLSGILGESLLDFYPQFKAKGWTPLVVMPEEDVFVIADAEALRRVFRNLMANTLIHGEEAPRITVCKERVLIENRIAQPQGLKVDSLFKRFYTADRKSEARGSGLGLAIVAHLVKAMGMKVEASLEEDILCVCLVFSERLAMREAERG